MTICTTIYYYYYGYYLLLLTPSFSAFVFPAKYSRLRGGSRARWR